MRATLTLVIAATTAVAASVRPSAQQAAPDRGATVAIEQFEYVRSIPDGPPGLVSLTLDAAALAHSRGPQRNFADVRIVDAQNRQIPYLFSLHVGASVVETLQLRQGSTRVVSLTDPGGGRRSIYAITLPVPQIPDSRLVFGTDARVFRRTVQVGVERLVDPNRREPWFEVLASAVWQHADQSTPAAALVLPLPPTRATDLLVVVAEGDNRPLAITEVKLMLPAWRLRFVRPADPIRLIYGARSGSDIQAPQYDWALLGPAMFEADAPEIAAGPEPPPAAPAPALLSPRLFWIGLALAVLVLLGLIAKLISSGTPPRPSPPGP